MTSNMGERSNTITIRKFKIQGDRNSYEQCLDYIYEQKLALDTSSYGNHKATLIRVLDTEQTRAQEIANFRREVDKVLNNEVDPVKRANLEEAFNNLKELSEKKLHCTETMFQVANMEKDCGMLSRTIDKRAVSLVKLGERAGRQVDDDVEAPEGLNIHGFLAANARDCVYGLQDNWDWLVKLIKCTDIHLKNSSRYHQYFHELDESGKWMLSDLGRMFKAQELYQLTGDNKDAQKLLQEIEDLLVVLRQWEAKVDRHWSEAATVVPVHYRTSKLDKPMPCRALVDYAMDGVKIREGEDLLLLESTNPDYWRVRNCRGQETDVPPLIILIPGPFKEAIDAAVKLRLQLLTSWTNTIKRVGQRLICFLLLVFKPDYSTEQIELMKSIGQYDKQELNRILDKIEDIMKAHWHDHEGFLGLQERLLSLRMILEMEGEGKSLDENEQRSLVVQIRSLESVMDKYKELWQDWEGYKTAVESSRAPELMLIADKWEQLQFVSKAYFSKFWKTNLPFDELEKSLLSLRGIAKTQSEQENKVKNGAILQEAEMFEEGMSEERVVEERMETIESASRDEVEGTDLGMATETKTAETEQLNSAKMEEKKTFIIKSVIRPNDKVEISLQEAIVQGIIRPNEGVYHNAVSGETVPIPVAMSNGLIKVEFTSVKRSKEQKSSIGIITVKTTRESIRPYIIKSVRDTFTGKNVSQEEASKLDILIESRGVYRDRINGRQMMISEAIEKKLVIVEYQGVAPGPVIIAKTFAVRGVVDRRANKTIPFQDAVRRGIINRNTGAFLDTLNNEEMYVGDAIMRGFLKAREMSADEHDSLDIDPNNTILVDKTDTIRKKLLQPLNVISAFKKAASGGAPKNGAAK